MENHINNQLRKMRTKLRKEFNKSFMEGEVETIISCEDSMDWKEVDSYLSKEMKEYEEALNDDRSCWKGIIDFSVECESVIDTKSWKITVCWFMDGYDNPFWLYDEDEF